MAIIGVMQVTIAQGGYHGNEISEFLDVLIQHHIYRLVNTACILP